MKKAKRLLILLIILGVVIVIAVIFFMTNLPKKLQSQAAAGQPTLTLTPNTTSVQINTPLNVDIVFDAAGLSTAGVQIAYLHYNPTYFDVIDADTTATGVQIATGALAGSGKPFETVIANSVDTTTGKISFSAASFTNTVTTSGVLATINFRSKATTVANTPVTFDFTPGSKVYTSVADLTGANVLYSVGAGSYTIINNITLNLSLGLQSGSNFSTTGTKFYIYQPGTHTIVYQKLDVATNNTGQASITLSAPASGNYDYQIAANGYLRKDIKNTAISPIPTLSFGTLKAGDLDNDNTIALADFIIFRGKWLQSDPVSDFDQDSTVTLSDFITLRSNWLQNGD